MKKNWLFIALLITGAVLATLNLIYFIIFMVQYAQFTGGVTELFSGSLHLDLLITLIVLNSVYVVGLGLYFTLRKLRSNKMNNTK